jgi:hypothetical protein
MAILDQIFFWSVIFATVIEIILLVIIVVRKKKLLTEESRKVFEDNKNIFFIAVGFMLVTILFELIGEISELFASESLIIEFIEKIHMTVLLGSLIMIGILTYEMVRAQ